jgi:hydrogenase maturation protease
VSADDILVAGIGNVFLGDDGFGVAVIQALSKSPRPSGVEVVDFGIRGFDLTYALMKPWRAAILVDATKRGSTPGTLYVIDPEPDRALPPEAKPPDPRELIVDIHAMNLANVFRFIRTMGGSFPLLRVVGCEPETFGTAEEPADGLSPAVANAVEPALVLIAELIAALKRGTLPEAAS